MSAQGAEADLGNSKYIHVRITHFYDRITVQVAPLGEVEELSVLASRMADLLDPQMDWSDVEWLRKIWKRPLLIKGILHPDDATKALDLGVDGVIV